MSITDRRPPLRRIPAPRPPLLHGRTLGRRSPLCHGRRKTKHPHRVRTTFFSQPLPLGVVNKDACLQWGFSELGWVYLWGLRRFLLWRRRYGFLEVVMKMGTRTRILMPLRRLPLPHVRARNRQVFLQQTLTASNLANQKSPKKPLRMVRWRNTTRPRKRKARRSCQRT